MDAIAWTREVEDAVRDAGVVDAHHHMITPAQRKKRAAGLIDWMRESYLASDLAAAGLDWPSIADANDEVAWRAIADVLPRTRFTSYYRVVDVALREIFAVQGPLWEADWRDLDGKIRAVSCDESCGDRILRETAGLTHGVLDRQATGTTNIFLREGHADWYAFILRTRPGIDDDKVLSSITKRDHLPPIWTPSVKIDAMLWGYLPESHAELESLYHVPVPDIATLDDYLAWVEDCFAKMKDEGAVALKCAFAGVRRIDYRLVSRKTADAVFATPVEKWTRKDAIAFEDFMIGHLADRAAEHGLPFQFHTGTPFSGPVADRDDCCDLMTDLVRAHPDTTFVLMHGSFPFTRQLADLAKRFSNVVVGLSWLPMLSQAAAASAVAEFVTTVPHEKIVWGGDCVFVEETLGAFRVGVESVAAGLAQLIDSGWLTRDDALQIAQRIMGANARETFNLR